MLFFFPRDVLDDIWDLSQFLKVFLPTFSMKYFTVGKVYTDEGGIKQLICLYQR